ncbi:MAG: zf-HC2 domain-containing protein [Dehalococcoidia bacterium]
MDETPSTPQERLEELLSAYLDGEVTAAEATEVEAALEADPAARDTLEALRTMTSAFASLGEVRAPRSFAIPAAPTVAATGPLATFRSIEVFMRASAAVAALFFVVAVATPNGADTPVANFATQAESDAAGGMATLQSAEEVTPGDAPAPSFGPPSAEDAGASDAGNDADAGGGTDAGDGATPSVDFGATGLADGERSAGDEPTDDGADRRSDEGALETLKAPEPGTFGGAVSSDGVGGVAPALATLALLLTALSVLLARTRARG